MPSHSPRPRQRPRALRIPVLLAALIAASLGACEQTPRLTVHGDLYFAAGSYLGSLRLSTGEIRPIRDFGDWRIQHISAYPNEQLLVSLSSIVADRPRERLARVDPGTGQEFPLTSGKSGQYLPGTDSVLYVAGNRLVYAARTELSRAGTEVHSLGWGVTPAVVPLDAGAVLFAAGGDVLRRFDAESGRTENLDRLARLCDWQTAISLGGPGQIACRRSAQLPGNPGVMVISLDAARSTYLPLPADRGFRPVAYAAEQRILILSESRTHWLTRRREHPVWAYALETGRLDKLAGDQELGESVVYRR